MQPSLWGRDLWKSLHFIALAYPTKPDLNDKMHYKAFFSNLHKVLPCYQCSVNYQKHLQQLPIDDYLSDNERLFEWSVMMHNLVNKDTGKREISVEQAKRHLFASKKYNVHMIVTALLVILTAIVVYVLAKTKNI